MNEQSLLGTLAAVLIVGIACEWLAWRLRLPAVLLLIGAGLIAGPLTGLVATGPAIEGILLPVVSLAVAVILFESGLDLRWHELRRVGGVVLALVTLGMFVTAAIGAAAAWSILGFSPPLAILTGFVLSVSGPSVVWSLLSHIRPSARVSTILRTESVSGDAIGAMLAVLVFQALFAQGDADAASLALRSVIQTIVLGSLIGAAAAGILVALLGRYLVPDHLVNPAALALAVVAFAASNALVPQSGLFSAAVMGVLIANQRQVPTRDIRHFQKTLRTLIMSSLLILLSMRLDRDQIAGLGVRSLLLLAVLVLVARPVSVALSTIRSRLERPERLFLAWMAPRGFVAAALASLFGIRLSQEGVPGADELIPHVFAVVVGTVALYGLTARPVGKLLGVAESRRQGVLFVGAYQWVRAMAKALQEEGFPVLLVDTNRDNTAKARMEQLPAYHGSILSEEVLEQPELHGIGRLAALTSNDEVNALAALRFEEPWGRSAVYQLRPDREATDKAVSHRLRGRPLFGPDISFTTLTVRFAAGATIRKTRLTDRFRYEDLAASHPGLTPLFVITEQGKLEITTAISSVEPRPGQTLVYIA